MQLIIIMVSSLLISLTVLADDSIQPISNHKDYGLLGEQLLQEQQYDKAIIATRQAIFKAQENNAVAWLIRWQWQLGKIFVKQGNTDQAIDAFSQAVHILVPSGTAFGWQMTECNVPNNISLYQKLRPLFFELIDLLLQRAKKADLRHAIDTIEKLKVADIEYYFNNCFNTISEKNIVLDSTTAVIYPLLLNERLELLVSSDNNTIHQFKVIVKRGKVIDTVQKFRSYLPIGRYGQENTDYLFYAQQLYQWLIEPLREVLERQSIDTIVFVPEGILNMMPMAALHDGKQFLIENFAVAITPSLNLTDLSPNFVEQILISGLTDKSQGYPKLPYAQAEIDFMIEIYPDVKKLLNKQFTANDFKQSIKKSNYDLIHIVSHAEFAENVKDSFIVTNDDKLRFNNKLFTKHLELLTLSACNTAQGDNEWAALGLSGVAVQTGAKSSLATLWKAHDEVTYHLIKDFYKYKSSNSKAKALQKSQQEVLKSTFHHPFYWADLVLIGNWL